MSVPFRFPVARILNSNVGRKVTASLVAGAAAVSAFGTAKVFDPNLGKQLKHAAVDVYDHIVPETVTRTGGPYLRPYKSIPAQAIAAARARSQGMSGPMGFTYGDAANTGMNEPQSIVLQGTPEQVAAMKKAMGEETAHGGTLRTTYADVAAWVFPVIKLPVHGESMSDAYVGTQKQNTEYESDDVSHTARFHDREWELQTPVCITAPPSVTDTSLGPRTGNTITLRGPVEGESNTVDTSWSYNTRTGKSTHHIDKNIDLSRDDQMARMLATGMVANWYIVKGTGSDADMATLHRKFNTDGNFYVVQLKSR